MLVSLVAKPPPVVLFYEGYCHKLKISYHFGLA